MVATPSGRTIARNSIYNLLGLGLPFAVAVACVPILVHQLGAERFAILSFLWAITTYFNLFDLGISRAITNAIAGRIARHDMESVPALAWTGFALLATIGALAAAAFLLLTPVLTGRLLHLPATLAADTQVVFAVLAFSVPIQLLGVGARSLLEAQQRFDLVNAVKAPYNAFLFLIPTAVALYSTNLGSIAVAILLLHITCTMAYFLLAVRTLPVVATPRWPHAASVKSLVTFGGWLTISSLTAPFLGHMDRFLIGSVASLTMVTYYTIPYDFVTRLWVIPNSVVTALFPAISAVENADVLYIRQMFMRSVSYLAMLMAPLVFGIVILAHPILSIWISDDVAGHSTTVLQLLALGVFTTSLSWVAVTVLQAAGRPDLVAKVHLVELPVYLIAVWLAMSTAGLNAVAAVWFAKASVEACITFWLVVRLTRGAQAQPIRPRGAPAMGAIAAVVAFVVGQQPSVQVQLVSAVLLSLAALVIVVRLLSRLRHAHIQPPSYVPTNAAAKQ